MGCVVYASAVLMMLMSFSATAHASDYDILNFALNLEYLEAEFYSWAAYGHGIPAYLRGGGPPATGGQKAKLSPDVQKYADSIAQDEISHVIFLRSALGKYAVPQPKIDIGAAFAAAGNAAFGKTLSPAFSPYGSDVAFILGAFIFEDVGATAYHGAAPLIKSKAYLSAAAGVLGTEAYHAGALRAILLNYGYSTQVYGTPLDKVVGAISNLRDSVDGKSDDDKGIIEGGKYVIAPVDGNHLIFARTTGQVLPIVYLGGKKKGGFFPNGLNGNIK